VILWELEAVRRPPRRSAVGSVGNARPLGRSVVQVVSDSRRLSTQRHCPQQSGLDGIFHLLLSKFAAVAVERAVARPLPAQIPACGFLAPGSSDCLASTNAATQASLPSPAPLWTSWTMLHSKTVLMTTALALKSRMTRECYVSFWSGGARSDPLTDHN
jgi:hypothetical protein